MPRRTRCLSSLLLLAVLVGVPVLLTWRVIGQERLNRALISAVKRQDAHTVGVLLARGADANSRDFPPNRRPLLLLLLGRLQHKPHNRPFARTALSVLLHNTRYVADTPINFPGRLEFSIQGKQMPMRLVEICNNRVHITEPTPENVGIAQALIQHGADVNALDERGQTPVCLAAEADKADTLKLLLAHGADPNRADESNMVPLMAVLDIASVARLLIEGGADVNKPDVDGHTALMWTDNAALVGLLLAHGADVNRQDKQGRTALFYQRPPFVMKTLLLHADLRIRDKQSFTALGYYLHSPNINRSIKATQAVIQLLKQAGAKE